jgi:sRNA-binding carbon storage regulator CsrA
MKVGAQDVFGVGKFKLYIVAVETAGVAFRVENGGKKPRDYYLKDNGKGVRLSPDVSVTLKGMADNQLADVEIAHEAGQCPKWLKVKSGSLVLSRRKAEQVIIDKGRAVVSVMAFDETRCSIHICHAGKNVERFLVVGESPVAIMPKVRVEYFGLWGQNVAKLKFTAPRHISIDRHEVHMRKEYDVQTIEENG